MGDCYVQARLPDNIRTIDVAWTIDGKFVNSVTFHGDTVLIIGGNEIEDMANDYKKGRVDVITIEKTQTFYGFEILHDNYVRGLRLLTWTPPVDLRVDIVPEQPVTTIVKCTCIEGNEYDYFDNCTKCCRLKKLPREGFTCDKDDELVFHFASDDAPKQWCSICAN